MDRFCLKYTIKEMFNPVYRTDNTDLLIFVDNMGDFCTCFPDYWGIEWRLIGLVKRI